MRQRSARRRTSRTSASSLRVIANADDKRPEGVLVFNFAVEGSHTYFVEDGAGENDWAWVHNSCWNTFQQATKGQFATRGAAAAAWKSVKSELSAGIGRVARPTGPFSSKLNNYVEALYKGARNLHPLGTGSTADAIRMEHIVASIFNKTHTQKGRDLLRGLQNNFGKFSRSEQPIAQALINDLRNALSGR